MKTSISILFLLSLLLSQTGVWVSKHFCGGVEKGVSLYVDAPACCPMEEPGDADACCKNENKVFVEDFSFVSQEVSSEIQPIFIALNQPAFCLIQIEPLNQHTLKWEPSPPPDFLTEHRILFSQFLI